MTKKTWPLIGTLLLAACFTLACKEKTPPLAEEEVIVEETGIIETTPAAESTGTLAELRKQYFQERKTTAEGLKSGADKGFKAVNRNLNKARKALLDRYVAENPSVATPLDETARAGFKSYIGALPKSDTEKQAYQKANAAYDEYLRGKNPELKALADQIKALRKQEQKKSKP